MNNKENAVAGDEGGLSAEQRARISQKFRSAKALLDRNRPRLSLSGSRLFPSEADDARNAESPARVNGFRRIPLSEIPMNSINISLGEDFIHEVHSIREPVTNRIIGNEGASALIPINSKSISLGGNAIPEVHSIREPENNRVIRNEDASLFIPIDSTSISLGEDSIPEVHSICEPEHDRIIGNEDASFFIPTNSISISLDRDLIPEVHSICEAENNRIIGNEDASFLRPHVTPIELEECHNLCNGAEAGVCDNGNISFSSPVIQHSNVGYGDSLESSAATVLDDCFDDVILEEIDALCEKSAAQSERAAPNSTFVETLPIDWKTEEGNGIASLMVAIEKAEGTVNNSSGDQVGGSRNSLAVLLNCILRSIQNI